MEREIQTHKSNELNERLTLVAVDAVEFNSNHDYRIRYTPDVDGGQSELARIFFQKGPVKTHGVNGVTQELLLAVVQDRLENFQNSTFACEENAVALDHVKKALEAMKSRTKKRQERGVEGTYNV